MRTIALLLAAGLLASAQLPRSPRRSENEESSKVTATGMIREMDDKSISLDASDSRILEIKLSTRTSYRKNDADIALSTVHAGDTVRIDAIEDHEGYWTASTVVVLKSGGLPSEKPSVLRNSETPEQVAASRRAAGSVRKDDDEDGPPKLRRGIPKPRRHTASEDETPATETPSRASISESSAPETAVTPVSAPVDPKQQLVDRAREAALNFSEALPNYVAQQFTTRYIREGDRWRALDVVSATVVYENGKESYRDIQINRKPIKKSMEEMSGAWSTGEFGTTLRSLFDLRSAAQFDFRKQSQIEGFTAMVYDYAVDRQHSDWRIRVGSQAILPAFLGKVWIESKSARALRIEMSAVEIPETFPMDKVEAAQDYGHVRLGTDEYLLPVHAENLSCERGSSMCSRNVIDFRNYHKYQGETKIIFDK